MLINNIVMQNLKFNMDIWETNLYNYLKILPKKEINKFEH